MKQHITPQQYKQLKGKAKQKYFDFLKKGEIVDVDKDWLGWIQVGSCQFTDEENENPIILMSIGQMIEFILDTQKKHKGKVYIKDDGVLSIMFGMSDKRPIKTLTWQGELCDSLWEAVKSILNK